MKKKLFKKGVSLLLSLGCTMSCTYTTFPQISKIKPIIATAEVYGDYNYEIDGRKCIITAYKGCDSSVTIPEKIEGVSVTRIGERAFAGCESLVYVTLPKNVALICKDAFADCTSLKRITIWNPGCEIKGGGSTIYKDTVICSYEESQAASYAFWNDRKFVCLDEKIQPAVTTASISPVVTSSTTTFITRPYTTASTTASTTSGDTTTSFATNTTTTKPYTTTSSATYTTTTEPFTTTSSATYTTTTEPFITTSSATNTATTRPYTTTTSATSTTTTEPFTTTSSATTTTTTRPFTTTSSATTTTTTRPFTTTSSATNTTTTSPATTTSSATTKANPEIKTNLTMDIIGTKDNVKATFLLSRNVEKSAKAVESGYIYSKTGADITGITYDSKKIDGVNIKKRYAEVTTNDGSIQFSVTDEGKGISIMGYVVYETPTGKFAQYTPVKIVTYEQAVNETVTSGFRTEVYSVKDGNKVTFRNYRSADGEKMTILESGFIYSKTGADITNATVESGIDGTNIKRSYTNDPRLIATIQQSITDTGSGIRIKGYIKYQTSNGIQYEYSNVINTTYAEAAAKLLG